MTMCACVSVRTPNKAKHENRFWNVSPKLDGASIRMESSPVDFGPPQTLPVVHVEQAADHVARRGRDVRRELDGHSKKHLIRLAGVLLRCLQ